VTDHQSPEGPSTGPSLWGGISLLLVKIDEALLIVRQVLDGPSLFPSHLTMLY
ncbi:hypothetical protein HAX54_036461, partial [Datura stramonium]|nr:hypothetical protein [Datura stramonium]